MSIVAAIIDSREPAWVQRLTFGGAMVACSPLDAGDLLATCDDGALLAVERKTPSDLLGSIRDDRLWAQLAGMRKVTPWAYLVITGDLRCSTDGKVLTDSRGTAWNWASVQGALLQAQEMGVFVVQCAGDDDYEPAVLRLAARSHKPEMVVPPAREAIPMSPAERILQSLPGIGLERAKAVLKYCGTVAWALNFLTSPDPVFDDKVPGIGPATKRAVRQALGLQDDEEMAVYISEQVPVAENAAQTRQEQVA